MIDLGYITICILGYLLGRLLIIFIDRIPRGEFTTFPPSHYSLPVSGNRLFAKHGIGLLSSGVFLMIYYQYGFGLKAFILIIVVGALITASVIDFKLLVIPDEINLFITMTGVAGVITGVTVTPFQSLLGCVIGGGSLLLIGFISGWLLKIEGMGGGDVKLAAACGFCLGLEGTIFALITTAYLAGFILLALLAAKKINKDQYIPFGPFLSAGVIITIIFFDKLSKIIV